MINWKCNVAICMTILAVIFLTCSKDSPSESQKELTLSEKLQTALDDGLKAYDGKGISAAVMIPGEALWMGVSGVSHGTTPINSNTVFSAGSITKMFTAANILLLAEEGKLSLEDSLHNWLPRFPHIDSTITLIQLLNHTNGIFNITENPDVWHEIFSNPDKIWTMEDIVRTYVLEPYFPKGTSWHYSNTGYLLLRMIIKEASGSSISSEYRNRFFAPLGFNNSYLVMEESLPANFAHGWWDFEMDGQYDDLSQISMNAFYSGVGGGVFCTAEELAKWAGALLREGTVLSQASLNQMLTFHSPCPDESLVAGYGLGCVRYEPSIFNGLEIWGHSGDAPGYAAASFYLPDYDVCMGFMDNTEEGDAMYTINDLLSIVISHLE